MHVTVGFPSKGKATVNMLLVRGCNSAGVHSLSITTMVHPSMGVPQPRATHLARGYAQREPPLSPDHEDLFMVLQGWW